MDCYKKLEQSICLAKQRVKLEMKKYFEKLTDSSEK